MLSQKIKGVRAKRAEARALRAMLYERYGRGVISAIAEETGYPRERVSRVLGGHETSEPMLEKIRALVAEDVGYAQKETA